MKRLVNCNGAVMDRLSTLTKICLLTVPLFTSCEFLTESSAIAQEFLGEVSEERDSHLQEFIDQPQSDEVFAEQLLADGEFDTSIAKESLRLPPLFRVGANSESGGIPDSLTAFDGFFPVQQSPGHNVTFFNSRLNIDFDSSNSLGGTVLLGHRSYSSEQERILGGYLAFDVRDTGDSTFPQVGFGFERLGKRWDIRANGYVPVGNTRQRTDRDIYTSSTSNTEIGETAFRGNLLSTTFTTTSTDVFTQIDRFEVALGGFDVEVGTSLARWNEHGALRLHGGVYYLGGHDVSAVGGRGRIEIVPAESIRLMAGIQGDPVFDVRGFFAASFLFPTPRSFKAEVNSGEREEAIAAVGETVIRLADPIYRDFNVVVDDHSEVESLTTVSTTREEVPYINPATGEPWRFTHVATRGGINGTFESPFRLLQDGLDATVGDGNDIVYVALADDARVPPFTIPDNVQVLSTGPLQELAATLAGTSITSVVLPGSSDGNFPDVTDTARMGSNTKLSGFDITGMTDSALIVPTGTRGWVEISDNTMTSLVDDGVEIEDISGGLDLILTRNAISSVNDTGIDVGRISGSNTTLEFSDNDLRDLQGEGDGIHLDEIIGDVDLLIARNDISGFGSVTTIPVPLGAPFIDDNGGIEIAGISGTSNTNIEIVNNTIGSPTPIVNPLFEIIAGHGIDIEEITEDSVVDVMIAENTINGKLRRGIVFSSVREEFIALTDNAEANISIVDNTIENSEFSSIEIRQIYGNSVANINIDGNTISSDTSRTVEIGDMIFLRRPSGIRIEDVNDTARANVDITNNIINFPSTGMIIGNTEDDATSSILISGNEINDALSGSIALTSQIGSSITDVTISNNNISRGGRDGIRFGFFSTARNNADTTISITGNVISDSADSGIVFADIQQNATADITISGNIISRSGEDGIAFNGLEDNAEVSLSIADNQILASDGFGVELDVIEDTSNVTIDIRDNTIDDTRFDGVHVDIEDSATVNITVSNNTIEETGTTGIDVDNGSQNTNLAANQNIFTDNGGTGFRLTNQASGSVCLVLDSNNGSNSAVAEFELANLAIATNFEIVGLDDITMRNTGTFDPADIETNSGFTDVESCMP